ncbi:MAG: DmsC/YnfH family molybdoenzyme membrane anchor subunit, partial [Deltaproteobacteria bacterium]|nr:DmsC/YnfH family molybdoenzyme membrane anchor subunit [Deltaproteobacteria bacterium]
SGLYLIALSYQNLPAMLFGWFIAVVLKGICHILYLGQPFRVWRAFTRLQTSWISRGLLFVFGFGFFAALQMAPVFFPLLPWTGQSPLLNALVIIFALLLMMYPGFALAYVNAVPLWNNALLPVLFVLYAFMGGLGLFLPLGLYGGLEYRDVLFLEHNIRFLLLVSSVLLAIYLVTVGYTGRAGKESLLVLLRGDSSAMFYGGVVCLGILMPFIASLFLYATGNLSRPLLYTAMFGELTGSFLLRYCLLRAGIYMCLIPKNSLK